MRMDSKMVGVSMQKRKVLSNNKRGEAIKNDAFLQAKRFFDRKKYKCRLLTFLRKTSKFLKKFILYEKKYKSELDAIILMKKLFARTAKAQKKLIIF